MEELLRKLGVVINRAGSGEGGGGGKEPPADEGGDEEDGTEQPAPKEGGDGDGSKAPVEAKPSWPEKRIGQLTREKTTLENENKVLKEKLAKAAEPKPGDQQQQDQQQPKAKTQAEIDAEIERKAEEKAAAKAVQAAFDRRSDEVYAAGVAEYTKKEWDAALAQFTIIGGGLATMEKDHGFMSAAYETSNPAKVFYDLSQNPDEAQRILSLSPAKMAIEMEKIAKTKPKKQTSAPNPPNPVGGEGGRGDGLNDEEPTEDWMRKRQEHVDKTNRRRLIPGARV